MMHAASAASPLFVTAPQSFHLLGAHQAIHLLECFLAQLLDFLLFLLGSQRAVGAHCFHLGVHGLANLPELGYC